MTGPPAVPKPPQRAAQDPRPISNPERVVLEYLRRHGYKSAEREFLRQAGVNTPRSADEQPSSTVGDPLNAADLDGAYVDDDLRHMLNMLRDAARYEDSYAELRDWVDGSLEMYKPQLASVLYPLLIHCFLEMIRRDRWADARLFLHRCTPEFTNAAVTLDGSSDVTCAWRKRELQALAGVASPRHIEENEVATLYLSYRYEIYLSYFAFELLVSFLAEDSRRIVLLSILNQRCRIKFDSAIDGPHLCRLLTPEGDQDRRGPKRNGGIMAEDEKEKDKLLETAVIWGRLRTEHYTMGDEEAASLNKAKSAGGKKSGEKGKADSSKKDGAASGSGGAAGTGLSGAATAGGGNENASNSAGNAAGDNSTQEATTDDDEEDAVVCDDGTISKSKIPLRRYCVGTPVLETVADRKARARLRVSDAVNGIRKDLAILFYTFTNTRNDGLNCSAVSEDGSRIAAGFGDSSVRVWDARVAGTAGSDSGGLQGRAMRLIGHSGPVYGVDWSKCGDYVLSSSEDGMIRLWHMPLQADLVVYRGHNFPVWDVQFSPFDHYFATAGHDRTARIWTTDRVHPLRILCGHLSDVDVVRWHPNVNYVATGSSDRCIRLWDVRDGNCVRIMRAPDPVTALAFAPDGRTVASAGDSGSIRVWDIADGNMVKELKGHRSAVWSLDYSREGAVLASAGSDWRVCTWRAEEWNTCTGDDDDDTNGDGDGDELNNAGGGGGSVPDGGDSGAGNAGANNNSGDAEGEGGDKSGGGGEAAAGDQAGVDGDGDVKMDGGGGGAKGDDGADKADGVAKPKSERGKSGKGAAAAGGAGRSVAKPKNWNWNDVPLVETFETKETPVQLVKFTRKNLLVATGSFGT